MTSCDSPFFSLLILALLISVSLAQPLCMGRGYKTLNGDCICKTSYYGRNCQYKHCPFGPSWLSVPKEDNQRNDQLSECSDMGYCEPLDGTCQCRPGYDGRACERLTCPASLVDSNLGTIQSRTIANASQILVSKPTQKLVPCSGHGVCKTMREAASEYDGWRLTHPPVDYLNWDADRVTGCICDNGWDGPDCSLRSCPYGIDPLSPKNLNDRFETFQFECQADSGYFTLIVQGTPTLPIPFDADPSLVESALVSLPAVNKVKVSIEIPKYYSPHRLTFQTDPSEPNFLPLNAPTGQVSFDNQLTEDYLPRVCNKNFPVKTKIVFYDLIPGQDASSKMRFSSGKGTRIGHKSGSRVLLLPYATTHSAWQKEVEMTNVNGQADFINGHNPLNTRKKIDHKTSKEKNYFSLPPINLSPNNNPQIYMSTVQVITCPVCPTCGGSIRLSYNNDEKTTSEINIFDSNAAATIKDELLRIIEDSTSGQSTFKGSNAFYSSKSNIGTSSLNEGVDSAFPSWSDSRTNPWNKFDVKVQISSSSGSATSLCSTTEKRMTYITFHSPYGNLPFLNIVDNTLEDSADPTSDPIDFDFFTHKGTINFFECSNQGLCDREIGVCQCFQDFDSSTNRFVYRVLSSDGNNKLGPIPDCGYVPSPPLSSCTLRGDDVCNGHGRCDAVDSRCYCYEGWYGINCNLRTCPYSTSWFDEALGPYNAHNMAECGNRGTCDRRSGNCVCSDGFTGIGCEIKDCPREENGEACSGYGTCVNMYTFAKLYGFKYGESSASDLDLQGNVVYEDENSINAITNNGKGLNFDNLYITKDIGNDKVSYENGGKIFAKNVVNSKMDILYNKKIGGGGISLSPYELSKGLTGVDALKKTWDAFKWYECLCHSSVPQGSIGHPEKVPRASSAPVSGKYPGGKPLPGWKGYDCSWRRCPRAHNPLPNPDRVLLREVIPAEIPIQRLTCELTTTDEFYLSFNSYVVNNKIQKISSLNYFSNQKSLKISPTDTLAVLQRKINEGSLNLGNVTIRLVDEFNKAINNDLVAPVCDPSYSTTGTSIAFFFVNDIRELPLLKVTMDALPTVPAEISISMVSKGYGSNEECGGPNFGFCDPVSGTCKCDQGFSSSDGFGNPGAVGDCTYRDPNYY